MDKKSLHILIDKYFDANTSVEEERFLLKEVLQLEGKDPLADEVLAVMGYARNKLIKHRIPQIWKIAGIAAAVIAIGIGGISFISTVSDGTGNECYAYINGVRIENQTDISHLIQQQLGEISEADESMEESISNDLEDMSNALNLEML